jgi:NAD(P)-dependent dehydrogenase (short-subunit alcohol dehydrogenase family)
MGYATTFLHSQLFAKLPYPKSSFSGQTVIITGSNTGLGLEAARHIARLGASKVILACRTISKGQTAAANITSSEHLTSDRVEVWELDLSSYESVKAFSQRVQQLDRLDAFIQNAGILTAQYRLEEGEESTITVNVTSATLLGLLVLPKLRQSAKKYGVRGRLSFVGSDLQYIAKFKEAESTGSLYAALTTKENVDMDDR